MAPPQIVTLGPLVAANAALLAASQTPAGGVALTLTGTAIDVARRVRLTFGNEGSDRTLAVIGTNQTGNIIGETLAVANGGASHVDTQYDYASIISLTPSSGTWDAAVTVGTTGVASSVWKLLNIFDTRPQMSVSAQVTGTVNYSIEYTYDDPNNVLGNAINVPPKAINAPLLFTLSISADGLLNVGPVYAWRVTINSGTGSVSVTAIPAGMFE